MNLKFRLLRAHVWTVATFLPLVVKALPLRRVLRLMTPSEGRTPYRGLSTEQITGAVQYRLRSPRNMKRRACLRQGLLTYHFLRLAGWPAAAHFAVFPKPDEQGRMHAHCWVTLNNMNMTDPPLGPHAVVLRCGEEASPQPARETESGYQS